MPLIAQKHAATSEIGGDRAGHGGVAITLHWCIALLVILQFILAEFWGFVPHPARHFLIVTHMSLGIVLTVILVARLLWHWVPGRPIHTRATGLAARAAKIMHALLFILVGAQVALGLLVPWTNNRALSFFGLPIPSPFGHFSQATGDFVDQIHSVTAWSIIILATGHAGAALFHHFILRDDVLVRMAPLSAHPRRVTRSPLP